MASQALVRARAYADEHLRAITLQSAALPIGATDGRGLEVCITYEPVDVARALGGDWYDVLQLPTGCTYLAVGDVAGGGDDHVRLAPGQPLEFGHRRFQRRLVPIDDADAHAGGREPASEREADAGRAAGDEGGVA